ncbi:MAG: tetraacyldisaccharide 4'-kinase [Coxiellaceae bacterium]|jgi:tetraacyldisaccharide 4'-kinase|nr:tetraacyldisaccharide 4'-kinase [Coxiellaceae bacterium]
MINLIIPKFWQQRRIISYFLLPFSYIYLIIITLRKRYYQYRSKIIFLAPVIIVGNITIGGTGKTPLVICLANFLQQQGYNPGIIIRGYGGKNKGNPKLVTSKSNVEEVGDEALLITRQVTCPVIMNYDRVKAVKYLLKTYNCNVVISDDGLQHYRLPRDFEIAVIDDEFKFGNRFCLPAGPLREPLNRLNQIDFIIRNFNTQSPTRILANEYSMILEPIIFHNINNPSITKTARDFKGEIIHAVAGIGRPQKFFQTLRQLNLTIIEHAFPDHYIFRSIDLTFDEKTVIMTEKDAVKCDKMVDKNLWYLEVKVRLENRFTRALIHDLSYYS